MQSPANQALPINMGGLGIPTAADTALPAYLGSLIQTLDLQAKILGIPVNDLFLPVELLLAGFNVSMAPDNQLLLATLRESKQLNNNFVIQSCKQHELCKDWTENERSWNFYPKSRIPSVQSTIRG